MPLFVGLTGALALAVVWVFRRERALAVIGSARATLADWPVMARANELVGAWMQRRAAGNSLPPALYLRPEKGGPAVRLGAGDRARIVGRGPGVDVVVPDDTVSKVHASVAYDRATGRLRVRDLGSSNGTFVDGERIASAEAAIGARLRLGTVDYTISPDPTDETAAGGWMLSGFDASGRAVQFTLEPERDPQGRVTPTVWTLGRDPARAGFVIDDPSVSSLHAELTVEADDVLRLRDAGSMNGTRIDGESIGERTVILDTAGQDIAFGTARLRLSRLAT